MKHPPSQKLVEATLAEVQRMKEAGMKQVTPKELRVTLEGLGYSIAKHTVFNYTNTWNSPRFWLAKSVGYTEKATGLPYAHDQTKSPTLMTRPKALPSRLYRNSGAIISVSSVAESGSCKKSRNKA